jgi:hypothetical protein
MAKYNKQIVKKITDLIKADSYTIAEICSLSGINKDTYYTWLDEKPDFSDTIKKAKAEFDEYIVAEAKKSLVKMINGYTVQEKKTVTCDSGKKDETTGKPIVKIKEHSVTEKHIQPNVAATIFALVNRDPDNWKNRQSTELTGKDGKDLITGSIDVDEWIKTKSKK